VKVGPHRPRQFGHSLHPVLVRQSRALDYAAMSVVTDAPRWIEKLKTTGKWPSAAPVAHCNSHCIAGPMNWERNSTLILPAHYTTSLDAYAPASCAP
jgi:hypothetical protein